MKFLPLILNSWIIHIQPPIILPKPSVLFGKSECKTFPRRTWKNYRKLKDSQKMRWWRKNITLRKRIRSYNEYLLNLYLAQGKWAYEHWKGVAAAVCSSAGPTAQRDNPPPPDARARSPRTRPSGSSRWPGTGLRSYAVKWTNPSRHCGEGPRTPWAAMDLWGRGNPRTNARIAPCSEGHGKGRGSVGGGGGSGGPRGSLQGA